MMTDRGGGQDENGRHDAGEDHAVDASSRSGLSEMARWSLETEPQPDRLEELK